MKILGITVVAAAAAGAWLVGGGDHGAFTPSPVTHRTVGAHAGPSALEVSSASGVGGALAPATLTQVVQQYCVVCHNDQLLTGNQSFQDFQVENAADRAVTAERMIRKLRAGMMPPPGIPRPGGDTLIQLVETLEATVDRAAKANPNLGERRFARLSRAEYERVIKDLVALDVDAGRWLPPDVLMGSFDNQSGAQALTTTLLDAYLRAAIEVARLAVGNPDAVSIATIHKNPTQVSQHAWDHIEGTPFGTRGGMVVTQNFPADGEYVFLAETSLGAGNKVRFEDLDISIDGEPVALLMLENNGGRSAPIQTDPIFVKAGQHQVSAAFVDVVDGPYEDRFVPIEWSTAAGGAGQGAVTGLTHLTQLTITGPEKVAGVSDTGSRTKVFTCRPASATEQRPCAETILKGLATQGFRRPIKADDIASLMTFYDQGAAQGGFDVGVRTALEAILASPEFLFRLERRPEGAQAGQAYRVTDIDLASRLSFFLWAAEPDQELLAVAERGRLSNPGTLEQQVRRMLKDPRSEALSTRFLHLWLRLQDVGRVWPEPYFYPDFNQQMADGMKKETEMLFQHIVQEDLSVLELFEAKYTFINERLARHYEIPGVVGDEFRMVQYPDGRRLGVLGHGSMLQSTSMPNRTSPVLRGKWVMEVLMGTPPPPPPPNVPAFEASPQAAAGRRLTTRERMEAHAKSPVCASCHNFIDPIGLALDNFDAAGGWRVRENMAPLDTRGTYYDGTPISTLPELVGVLLKRPTPIVRNFTENLLAYAIGRPVEYFDQPTVRAIARGAEGNNYKVSALIMGVVQSDLFQMKQDLVTAN